MARLMSHRELRSAGYLLSPAHESYGWLHQRPFRSIIAEAFSVNFDHPLCFVPGTFDYNHRIAYPLSCLCY